MAHFSLPHNRNRFPNIRESIQYTSTFPIRRVHTFQRYARSIIKNGCLASPYVADSDLSSNFRDLNPIHHTIPSTIILYTTIFGNHQPPPFEESIHSIDQLQSDSIDYTLSFLKISPFLSDSIQYIDQLFHLHHNWPCYQTLHYYFRKYPTPLCKSIHSIDQLQSDSIDFTLSFRNISPC